MNKLNGIQSSTNRQKTLISIHFHEFYKQLIVKYKSILPLNPYYCIVMQMRKILYALMLAAYTLSLAHSVIPHHHHKTADEASTHHESHHHDSDNDHHHHGQESESQQESHDIGHFFFFSHDINADVLIRHSSIDNPVKIKKIFASVPVKDLVLFTSTSNYIVFHPPPDDQTSSSVTLPSNTLRGPPTLI